MVEFLRWRTGMRASELHRPAESKQVPNSLRVVTQPFDPTSRAQFRLLFREDGKIAGASHLIHCLIGIGSNVAEGRSGAYKLLRVEMQEQVSEALPAALVDCNG